MEKTSPEAPSVSRASAIRTLQSEAQAIMELIPQLDDQFDEAVELIYRCPGKVIVTGVGNCRHAVEHRHSRLLRQST